MSLAPHEERVLTKIENSLRSTDPALAGMLDRFSLARPLWMPPLAYRLPRRRTGPYVAAALILMILSAILCCAVLIRPSRPPRCPPPGTVSGHMVTCAPTGGGLAPAGHSASNELPGALRLQP